METNIVMKRQGTKCDMLPKKRACITDCNFISPPSGPVFTVPTKSIIATAPGAMAAASNSLAVHWRHGSAADRILAKIANRPSLACNRHKKSVGSSANVDTKVYCCKVTHHAETNCRVRKSCAVKKSSLLMMAK